MLAELLCFIFTACIIACFALFLIDREKIYLIGLFSSIICITLICLSNFYFVDTKETTYNNVKVISHSIRDINYYTMIANNDIVYSLHRSSEMPIIQTNNATLILKIKYPKFKYIQFDEWRRTEIIMKAN